MEDATQQYLILIVFKTIAIVCGLASIYLGYKLFVKGIFTQAGDVNAEFLNTKLIVRKSAPGTFFALFGSIVIIAAVLKEASVTTQSGDGSFTRVKSEAPNDIKLEGVESDNNDMETIKAPEYLNDEQTSSIVTGVPPSGNE